MAEELRAADTERAALVAVLEEHTGAGRLTLSEFSDRARQAWSARTIGELRALTQDLPDSRPPTATPHSAADQNQNQRVVPHAPCTAHWAPLLLTGLICLVIWVFTSIAAGGPGYFWPGWVVGPWAVVVLANRLGRRGQGRGPDTGARRAQ